MQRVVPTEQQLAEIYHSSLESEPWESGTWNYVVHSIHRTWERSRLLRKGKQYRARGLPLYRRSGNRKFDVKRSHSHRKSASLKTGRRQNESKSGAKRQTWFQRQSVWSGGGSNS